MQHTGAAGGCPAVVPVNTTLSELIGQPDLTTGAASANLGFSLSFDHTVSAPPRVKRAANRLLRTAKRFRLTRRANPVPPVPEAKSRCLTGRYKLWLVIGVSN